MTTIELGLPIVDSHVHWWDPAEPWFLVATQEQADMYGMGDISGMIRPFRPENYLSESAGHDIRKLVWITSTMNADGVTPEIDWAIEAAGDGNLLRAIIGNVDPTLPASKRQALLARQARDSRFRGLRALGGLDYGSRSADEYMKMLGDMGLIYEFAGHHESMADAAGLAERHPNVTWVVEHCGWPLVPNDPDYVSRWRAGISALAAVPNVHCKISGLAMSFHSFTAAQQRPFAEACLEAFGPERCFFGSNFPVDALYGTYDELMSMYVELTASMTLAQRQDFFAGNAERVYRI